MRRTIRPRFECKSKHEMVQCRESTPRASRKTTCKWLTPSSPRGMCPRPATLRSQSQRWRRGWPALALTAGAGREGRGEGKATLVSWKDTVLLTARTPWPLAFSLFRCKPLSVPWAQAQGPVKLFSSYYQVSCPTWRRHCMVQNQHYRLEAAKWFKDEHVALCTFGVIYGHSLLFL